MVTVVHVTGDYPDAHQPGKTPAVRRLLGLIPDCRNIVYSFNRLTGWGGAEIIDRRHDSIGADVATIVYRAPPFGVLLEKGLEPVARLIARDLAARDIRPDVIHAHKLTVDGLVAHAVAATVSCPLVCSIWGNTDQKIVNAKPMSRARFRAVAEASHAMLPATPWARDFAVEVLGVARDKLHIIPVVCDLQPTRCSPAAPDRVATLLNLDAYALKNIPRLIDAVARIRNGGRPAILDIFGGGSTRSVRALERHIARAGCHDAVRLRGPLARERVQDTLRDYAAFAMPSLRETYGMVFIEALFAGVPIVYPKGKAIDGFFDEVEVGQKCDARSVDDIARQLAAVLATETTLKRNISELHGRGFFRAFEAEAIGNAYRDVLADACGRRPAAPAQPIRGQLT